jgi:hypothetical protein
VTLAVPDLHKLIDDFGKRLRCVELVRARCTKERLDRSDVSEDQLPLEGGLAEVVSRTRLDPVEENVRGSAEQHDGVEAIVEAALIGDGA